MLVDAIASVILAGMMLIPLINLIVGIIVGAAVAGPAGIVLGVLLALAITAAESWWCHRLEWPGQVSHDSGAEPGLEATMAGAALALDTSMVEMAALRTGPPAPRRMLSRTGRPEAYHRTKMSSGETLKRAR